VACRRLEKTGMATKRLVLLVALFAVLAVALTAAYLQRDVPATQATWPGLPFQSEEQWIVSQTAAAVIDMAQFAKTAAPEPMQRLAISRMQQDLTRPRFTFRVGSRDVTINVTTHVWDPDPYVRLARESGAAPGSASASPNEEIVQALLDLRLDTLRLQNDAVSIALQKDYRNPANHEAAALLLAVFALREASGYFYDPRLVLSRAAAHLAVARAMRGESNQMSEAGQLAGIVLEIEAGRTAPAVARLETFERVHPSTATRSWARTLRRRATLDWREPVADDAPLPERLEYMGALARMLGVGRSLEYLTQHPIEEVPDWGWRTLDSQMTVESGNVLVDETIVRTLREAAVVFRVSSSATRADVAAVLSKESEVSSIGRSSGRVEVLDEGTWSAFYQRELAHVAMQASDFYRAMLGVPEEAKELEARLDALMGSTPLWPIVLRLRVESECKCGLKDASKRAEIIATYQSTMTRVASMIQAKPQTVPYMAWGWVLHVPPGAKPVDTPPRSRWFRTLYPTGTAFEPRRLQNQPVVPDDFVAHADAIHDLSPWDPIITLNWSNTLCYKKHGCTPQEESAHFTRVADYNLTAMRKAARADADPVAGMKRVCAVSAGDCWTLGDWLVSRERFPEASEAFQQFFDRELDRVSASNRIEWLVRYYEKTGRLKDARVVAQAAANVGSARGMQALAGLLDRQGDHRQAEQIYRQILERYEEGQDLLAFFLRRADATGVPPAAREYRTLLDRYFEGDLERVSADSLTGSPARGLYVQSTTYWNKNYFRQGDIIVAVDGIRVWKLNQSWIQYDRSFEAPLRYTVWRDGAYVDVEGPFRQHYYGVDAAEYPPPARQAAATAAH